jgi:hypothetical protein
MDTAWIQVFILTLTQCIAPEGKMVCQEETVEYQFADQVDCEIALYRMLDVAARADNVIVVRERSHCRTAAKETEVFASAEEAGAQFEGAENIALLQIEQPPPDFTQSAHMERLEKLHDCEEVANVPPCKIGEIIVEAAEEPESVAIWRRKN